MIGRWLVGWGRRLWWLWLGSVVLFLPLNLFLLWRGVEGHWEKQWLETRVIVEGINRTDHPIALASIESEGENQRLGGLVLSPGGRFSSYLRLADGPDRILVRWHRHDGPEQAQRFATTRRRPFSGVGWTCRFSLDLGEGAAPPPFCEPAAWHWDAYRQHASRPNSYLSVQPP